MKLSLYSVFRICIHLLLISGSQSNALFDMVKNGLFAIQCHMVECCGEPWIKKDMQGLSEDLNGKLHGQHFAKDVIIKSMRAHWRDDDPPKALVLSMHGWTGGGKNYVSRFIADRMYEKGLEESSMVNLIVATNSFPHASDTQMYKDQLSSWITGNVTICPRSLFIFDEMDKMPPGLIDVIKPFIDHHPRVGGVDYRKATFLFLSNTGGNDITSLTKEHWESGGKREDITLKDMEKAIKDGAFKEKGGLWHADLISKHLVSAFVPFLPLERSHVKACIRDYLRKKEWPVREEIVNKVADEMHYFPEDTKLFSTSGCKRVPEKVNYIMEDY